MIQEFKILFAIKIVLGKRLQRNTKVPYVMTNNI